MVNEQVEQSRYLERLRLTPLIGVLIALPLGVLLLVKLYGPSSVGSYELVFNEPPPPYIKTLKSEYHNHAKGYTVYIGMIVPPDKVSEIVDVAEFSPMKNSDSGQLENWANESMFRNLDIPEFPEVARCLISRTKEGGRSRETVISLESGHIFCQLAVDTD